MKTYKYEELRGVSPKDFALNYAPITDLVARKVDAINGVFGQPRDEEFSTVDCIEDLIADAVARLQEDKKAEPRISTGRMRVEMWVDGGENTGEDAKDDVRLEISYELVEL